MSSDKDPSLDAASESAVTTTVPTTSSSSTTLPIIPNLDPSIIAAIPVRADRPRSPESAGEEQALEWREVIELQEFSERRAWIEEKTRFLEQMPPIEVFVGLDAVRASAEEIPGLPTREELNQWLVEHDKIEKETEIFDSGELRKLKKFTKAAAQRNLSPADTDLIELTLTTIYALDKLLRLLRDRSNRLELLGDRLTWEERRIASWVELRSLQADLSTFLATRARWSPSVYDRVHDDEDSPPASEPSPLPTLRRKSSVSSLMSTASDSTISSLALSRGERFKLAETLSRDAAQFASRVSSLRHSKITAAGKALDKLIDDSRKPVPDELLDEQDKLEDKGINEMEDVGKFIMGVVMQWKKADEIYVETARDKSTAQTLLEEIEIAKLSHPTSRQDNAFLSRATALSKRLKMRENPSSSISVFLRPTHPLFPNQDSANDEISDILTAELASTQEQASEAERAAKEYHAILDKVKKVEALSNTAVDLTTQLESLSHRLETGIESDSGDGSPPTLSSESCLHSNSHSVFLAHFQELFDSVNEIEKAANDAVSSGRVALAALPRQGIDAQFKQDSITAFDRLASYCTSAINIRSSVASRVETLRKCRSIWSSMAETFDKVDNLRHDVVEAIQRQMYKPNASQDAALLTPESPSSVFAVPELTIVQANEQIDGLASAMGAAITTPLSAVTTSVGPALNTYLSGCSTGLQQSLDELRRLTQSWSQVQIQASEMDAVSDEVHALQMRSEHLKLQLDDGAQDILLGALSADDLRLKEAELEGEVRQLAADVKAFQDKLSSRIPFVGSGDRPRVSVSASSTARRRFSISTGFSLEVVRQAAQAGVPFDTAALDRAVRADANSYSILLAGEIEAVSRSSDHFRWAQQARAVDIAVTGVSEKLYEATTALNVLQASLNDHQKPIDLATLQSISAKVDDLHRQKGQSLATSYQDVRELLECLESVSSTRDPSYDATVLAPRRQAVKEAKSKLGHWTESIEVLSEQLSDIQHSERVRLEAEAAAIAAAEEAERLHREEGRLRMEEEENLRREEEERLRREEEERLRTEEEEMLRREEEDRLRRGEEERLRREEEERLRREEKERLRREEEERLRGEEEERMHSAEERSRREKEEWLLREKEEALRLNEERLRQEREKILREEAEEAKANARAAQAALAEARAETEKKAHVDRQVAGAQRPVEERETRTRRITKDPQQVTPRTVSKPRAVHPIEPVEQPSKGKGRANPTHRADVFGITRTDSMDSTKSDEDATLQTLIVGFRKRLRSLHINETARPPRDTTSSLPSPETVEAIKHQLETLQREVETLPASIPTAPYVDAELRSLRSELEASEKMLQSICCLSEFGAIVQRCDDLLSDLLEHIDSYPAPPMATLSTLHTSDTSRPPEDQISDRLAFTDKVVQELISHAKSLVGDSRITSECDRITQTWEELQAMGNDRVDGRKSRPPSAMSVGPSRALIAPSPVPPLPKQAEQRKPGPSYSRLSAAPPGSKYLAPPPIPRRSISRESSGAPSRSSSRASTTRSVSNPSTTTPVTSSRLYTSTFASRQRSSSINASISTIIESPHRATPPPGSGARAQGNRPRARTGQSTHERIASPLVTDMPRSQSRSSVHAPRSQSRSSVHAPRSSLSSSRPTWSRAPRQSFPNVPKSPPPRKPSSTVKTPYVPNPKNKLDMAVGDVINSLPVNINIEVVAETWKDQSGKYWIGGDDDPKLCFCRILRSQTVMVRVGGGWTELSKFIKEHFADSFRVLPLTESPPHKKAQEEKWISSAILAQAMSDKAQSPPLPPHTPEPQLPFIPSFALSTPSGTSPRTIKTSSPGSPLHAMQFIRRADRDSISSRPETPTRPPRPATSLSHNRKQPVWRP